MPQNLVQTLSESEIRPDALVKKQAELFSADIARLATRKADFVIVPCPACGSECPIVEFTKHAFDYQRCRACDTLYLSPRPTPEILANYYQTSENYVYWNQVLFPASEAARREKIFRPRVERIVEVCERFQVSQRLILEVGAGFGLFCEEMARTQFFDRVLAVEPTPDLAATCRQRGLEVIASPIEEVELGRDTVDVIASFEVLEHLFSPREFVEKCHSLLAPGGLLVLTCPSSRGFDVIQLRELSDTVDPEHLNYFHPESLSMMVAACGFEVLEVTTPGMLDAELVRKKALDGTVDLTSQPFLQHVLIDAWDQLGAAFQQFLVEHQLSSHMWLVARKGT